MITEIIIGHPLPRRLIVSDDLILTWLRHLTHGGDNIRNKSEQREVMRNTHVFFIRYMYIAYLFKSGVRSDFFTYFAPAILDERNSNENNLSERG